MTNVMTDAMTGTAPSMAAARSHDDRFIRRTATIMAVFFVVAFLFQWLMGRSSFAARPLVHGHALVAFGWVILFTVQSWLGSGGSIALHRRIGWIAVLWAGLLAIVSTAITVDVAQRGITPFFFRPAHFLVANPLSVLTFAAVLAGAIRFRRATDWHWRLQMSATAILLGPAFGRVLPMPLMTPYAFEIAGAACLVVPVIGAIRDRRTGGTVHPAWWWGAGAIVAAVLIGDLIGYSGVGLSIYEAVTAGFAGAIVDPMGFAAPPPS